MKFNEHLVFDIDNITDFVFGDPNERTSDVEITETYKFDKDSNKMNLDEKQVKEVKVNDYTGQNTIRYDLIKMFIDILDSIEDAEMMTLGQQITLNTMQSYELIKTVKE